MHPQLLADKIVSLGGTPTTVPAPVKPAQTRGRCSERPRDEIETIDRHVKRRSRPKSWPSRPAIDLDDLIRRTSPATGTIR
jgi:hypothetical protein